MTNPLRIPTPDARTLDVWLAGPADGDPLVFHMGTPSSGMPFEPHVEAMAARSLRYISWSRPGYGGSTRHEGRSVADVAADTRTVLDHLGLGPAWVVGWSGGGPHALACAALMPERVRGTAILAGVAPYPAEGLDWLGDMGAENIEEFEAALAGPEALIPFKERNRTIFLSLQAADVAHALGDLIDDVDRGSLSGPLADFLATSGHEAMRESYWGWYDDDMAFIKPWGFDIASIPGPVHLWQGAHDRMVPYAHGQWLASHVGCACPHLVPEHGHLSLVVDAFPRILDELIGGPA